MRGLYNAHWTSISYKTAYGFTCECVYSARACKCKPVFCAIKIPNSKSPLKFKAMHFYWALHFFAEGRAAKQKSGTLEYVLIRLPMLLITVVQQCMCSMKCARKIHDLVTPRNRTHCHSKLCILRSEHERTGQVYLRYNLSGLLTLYRHNMKNMCILIFRWSCW